MQPESQVEMVPTEVVFQSLKRDIPLCNLELCEVLDPSCPQVSIAQARGASNL